MSQQNLYLDERFPVSTINEWKVIILRLTVYIVNWYNVKYELQDLLSRVPNTYVACLYLQGETVSGIIKYTLITSKSGVPPK